MCHDCVQVPEESARVRTVQKALLKEGEACPVGVLMMYRWNAQRRSELEATRVLRCKDDGTTASYRKQWQTTRGEAND